MVIQYYVLCIRKIFLSFLFSYNGGTCVATSNAYICQCTYPYSGSNCEVTLATQATQPACACILCPCPTPTAAASNPCLYFRKFSLNRIELTFRSSKSLSKQWWLCCRSKYGSMLLSSIIYWLLLSIQYVRLH